MICVNHNRPRHPFRYLLVIPAVAMLALSACGAETSDESLPADDVSSNSSPANDSDANTPETESSPETGESQDTDDGAEVGPNNSPDGDGLTGDNLAENINKEYQPRWSEFLGLPMKNADRPVRTSGLAAAVRHAPPTVLAGLHRYHGGLAGDDALAADIDEGVGGPEVDREIVREQAAHPVKQHPRTFARSMAPDRRGPPGGGL